MFSRTLKVANDMRTSSSWINTLWAANPRLQKDLGTREEEKLRTCAVMAEANNAAMLTEQIVAPR